MMKKFMVLLVFFFLLLGCTNNPDDNISKENKIEESKIIELQQRIEGLEELIIKNEKKINELEVKISEQDDIISENSKSNIDLAYWDSISNDIYFELSNLSILKDISYRYLETRDNYEVIYCYLKNYNDDTTQIEVDIIEWITMDDQDRIDELNIEDDMPNGYFIYDDDKANDILESDEFFTCYENERNPKMLNRNSFFNNMKEKNSLCKVILIDGKVYQILEKYLP